ncbi:hypothetical protein [Massilia genomosp. 1]|uniref:Chemotaxis protein n=1 Tax=Massilia genomosp. 1 TaxID=2609280 RepID=A0ABX0MZB8_9BURK|nr:hypothetical protein [Massilia genomosp. 1]NHZ63219.1 hypothetical protein [Massilia genomosp. 1]
MADGDNPSPEAIAASARAIDECRALCAGYQAAYDDFDERLASVQEKIGAFKDRAAARLDAIGQEVVRIGESSEQKLLQLTHAVEQAAINAGRLGETHAARSAGLLDALGELDAAIESDHALALQECGELLAQTGAANGALDEHQERVQRSFDTTMPIVDAELAARASAQVAIATAEVDSLDDGIAGGLDALQATVDGAHQRIGATLAETRQALESLAYTLAAQLGSTEIAFASLHDNELANFLRDARSSYTVVRQETGKLVDSVGALGKTVGGVTDAVTQTQTGLQLVVDTLDRSAKLLASLASPF